MNCDGAENGSRNNESRDTTMHWLVAVLAAISGLTLSFSIFAFVWTWYVGTIVLVLASQDGEREVVPSESMRLARSRNG